MLRKSMLIATLTAFSAVFLFALFVGCNGSENYAPKEPGFSTNNPIGTFGAAGSTFIAPLFSRWSNDYVTSHHMRVNYRPIGSGVALGELKQGLLTFAATDAPLGDAELKDMPPLIQVPVTAGPVCVIYNVTGLTGSLKLGGKTLAGIYSGQIRTWDEAAIARESRSQVATHAHCCLSSSGRQWNDKHFHFLPQRCKPELGGKTRPWSFGRLANRNG